MELNEPKIFYAICTLLGSIFGAVLVYLANRGNTDSVAAGKLRDQLLALTEQYQHNEERNRAEYSGLQEKFNELSDRFQTELALRIRLEEENASLRTKVASEGVGK